jgi:hypothetical protein
MAVNSRSTTLTEIQKQLGMREGFDVGLETSGVPSAFQEIARQHESWREDRHAWNSVFRDGDRLAQGNFQWRPISSLPTLAELKQTACDKNLSSPSMTQARFHPKTN